MSDKQVSDVIIDENNVIIFAEDEKASGGE